MIPLSSTTRYYLYEGHTDMRKGFDSLSGLIRNSMEADPMSGAVYIFMNRRRTHMKLLLWDRTGYIMYWKRLEAGTFEIPKTQQGGYELKWRDLLLILEGVSLGSVQYRKRYSLAGKE